MLSTVDAIKAQRDRIVSELAALGATPVPSDSNFVLFGGLPDEKATWQALLDRGILVRDVGIRHHLRVTAGTPEETTRFLAAMAELARATSGRSPPRAPSIPYPSRPPRTTHDTRQQDGHDRSDDQGVVDRADRRPRRDGGLRRLDRRPVLRPHAGLLAKHSLIDLSVKATGDIHVDIHHTVEDTAIVLGQALREALGDKVGISASAMPPSRSTRPWSTPSSTSPADPTWSTRASRRASEYVLIGGHFTGSMTRHVFESFAYNAGLCLHVRVLASRDPHHIVEAQFKAVARALRAAITGTSGSSGSERQGGALTMSTPPRVVVLDYGSGNVRSAVRALERVGAAVDLTADPLALECHGLFVRESATSTPA